MKIIKENNDESLENNDESLAEVPRKPISPDTLKWCMYFFPVKLDKLKNLPLWDITSLFNNANKTLYRFGDNFAIIYGINTIGGAYNCDHSELNKIAENYFGRNAKYYINQLSTYDYLSGVVTQESDGVDESLVAEFEAYFR